MKRRLAFAVLETCENLFPIFLLSIILASLFRFLPMLDGEVCPLCDDCKDVWLIAGWLAISGFYGGVYLVCMVIRRLCCRIKTYFYSE